MKTTKRILAVFIAILMVVSVLPMTVLAARFNKDDYKWIHIAEHESKTEIESYTYVNDTDGVDSGSKYLIAAPSAGRILSADTFASSQVTVSGSGNTASITVNSDAHAWTITSVSGGYTIYDGSQYINLNHFIVTWKDLSNTPQTLDISSSSGTYKIRWKDSSWVSDSVYMTYSNGNFATAFNDNNASLRLFKYDHLTYKTIPAYDIGINGVKDRVYDTTVFANQAELEAALRSEIGFVVSHDGKESADAADYDLVCDKSVNPTANGEYSYDIKYEDRIVASFKVTFDTVVSVTPAVEIGYPFEGTVIKGSKGDVSTGAKIKVVYEVGEPKTLDVTLSMLVGEFNTKAVGKYENLAVKYGSKLTDNVFTLNVIEDPNSSDFPAFPNPGSVKVDKTATAVDFRASGLAQVELMASGIAINKGIDVIVMLDTSGSMSDSLGTSTRIAVLRQSLQDMIETFQAPASYGTSPDIRVAIGNFNGNTGIPNAQGQFTEPNTIGSAWSLSEAPQTGKIRTGEKAGASGASVEDYGDDLASAFVNVMTLTPQAVSAMVPTPNGGTNYDYAFDTVYKLGKAITEKNEEENEERDLYVIFMSDGAPYQFNYFYSSEGTSLWEDNWLTGQMPLNWTANRNVTAAYSYFYNDDETLADGKTAYSHSTNSHRMADAIKGSKDNMYAVIDPTYSLVSDENEKIEGKDYMVAVPGLDATVFTVGFCLNNDQTARYVVKDLASLDDNNASHVYYPNTAADLEGAFTGIASNIKIAATNAVVADKLGEDFAIQYMPKTYTLDGVEKTYIPEFNVKQYTLYTQADLDAKRITDENLIGTRIDDGKLIEKITYDTESGKLLSSLKGDEDILTKDGIINAQTFYFNTTDASIDVTEGGKTVTVNPQTFYWKIGSISNEQIALKYCVYLKGSIEGDLEDGIYKTNGTAELTYKNWLDHEVEIDPPSPICVWGIANMNFGYYLVNEDGKAINPAGTLVGIPNKYKLANPTVIQQELLEGETVTFSAKASDYVPEGYELYDKDAAYEVTVTTNGLGSKWKITKGTDTATTYVEDYGGTNPSNELVSEFSPENGYDYTHTTVWFALKLGFQCVPDTVVLDFGLPVDINVLANDMYGANGELFAIGPDGTYTDLSTPTGAFKNEITTEFGKAVIKDGKVRYTPSDEKTLNTTDKFTYVVKYKKAEGQFDYHYGTVSVVPATTVYYDDSFIKCDDKWTPVGELTALQAEDRPEFRWPDYASVIADANNNYGYDEVNESYSALSLGHISYAELSEDNPIAKAEFTFTGTGYELFAITGNNTGAIRAEVKDSEGKTVKDGIVDTFYGYTIDGTDYYKLVCRYSAALGTWSASKTKVEEKDVPAQYATELPAEPKDGQVCTIYECREHWKVSDASEGSNYLYHVPVIRTLGLPYGTYTVDLTVAYAKLFDHADAGKYYFYLDGIRIFNPASPESTINADVYAKDNEANAQFIDIRDNLIAAEALAPDGSEVDGAVFVDALADNTAATVDDLVKYGPNNEVYLTEGQAIAFRINNGGAKVKTVQLGLKGAFGSATVKVNGQEITANTSTDMYYDITDCIKWDGNDSKLIVIEGTDERIASLTTIKITSEIEKAVKTIRPTLYCANTDVLDLYESILNDYLAGHQGDITLPEIIALLGDANADGKLSAKDAAIILQAIAGWNVAISGDLADVNEDGVVNTKDVALVMQMIVK